MLRHLPRDGRRAAVRVAVAVTLGMLPLAACDNITEPLLEAVDPDIIDPVDIDSPEGADGLRLGALERFRNITGGDESTWLFGGLLADEWATSSTFVQNDETDQRRIQTNNSIITAMYREINQVRTASNQAIASLTEWTPDETVDIAELHFARGFAEMQLAQDFCNGIPLSDAAGEELVFGEPLPVSAVFEAAVTSYDEAIALVGGSTSTASVRIARAARIGKARALLGMDRAAEAAVAVQGIPTSYQYQHTFAVASGDNILWNQPTSSRRYAVGDSAEGNDRSIFVANAIPFFSAQDPRLPARYIVSATTGDTTDSQDGRTYARVTSLYGRLTPVDVVNGLDARLVEAEAALQAGNVTMMLEILNELRADPPQLGEIQPDAMDPLTDPGTEGARVDLLFREKAFWTFTRGQRLGDMRRLIRQYGRTPENTFPVGTHFRGGTYGDDVNLPVPQQEENNDLFEGCTDRNA